MTVINVDSYADNLRNELNRLKKERLDSATYQSVYAEADAMDYGPRYQERADELINNLDDKRRKLDLEIKAIENELNKLYH